MSQIGQTSRTVGAATKLPRRTRKLTGGHPLFLYSLRHPSLRLRSPIAVLLVHDGEQVIAAAYDLDIFGYGDTDSEALDDLRRAIADLYVTLKEHSTSLGPLPQRIWEYLSDVVEESRPK